MKAKIFETWLPLFPGFYGTHFELDTENYIYSENSEREYNNQTQIDYDCLEIDYDGYQNKVVQLCTDFVESELKELKMVHSINFQSISSPQYYNFSNDSGNIEVVLNKTNIKNIQKYLKVNEAQWAKYVKDHYTSRDGFWSHHSNYISDWQSETDNYTDFTQPHKLGAILSFILKNEYPDVYYSMVDYALENVSEYEFISIKDPEGQLLLNEVAGRNFLAEWINFEASQLPECNTDKSIFMAIVKSMTLDDIETVEYSDLNDELTAREFLSNMLVKYSMQTLTPEEVENNLKLAI